MPNVPSRCAAALLVLPAPLAGRAQTSPYYLGVSQTFGYDSNIFRLPDRSEVALPGGGVQVIEPQSSGLISTTLLLADLDQPIGRQRVYGSLSAGYSSYGDQPQLDSPRYALTAGVDWDTVEKLSGKAEFTSGLRLGAYGDRDVPTGRGDNEERYNRLSLLVRLGDWQRSHNWFEASFVYDQVSNDIETLQATPYRIEADPITGAPVVRFTDGYTRDDRYTAFTFGVRHRWSGAPTLGAGLRTESRREEVDRHLIDPMATVNSRLDSRRNDIDLFANLNPGDGNQLNARLSYGNRDYDDLGGFTDDDTNFQPGLSWAALRNTTVGCSLGLDRRDSSYQGTASGRSSYDATLTSCYAQVLLR